MFKSYYKILILSLVPIFAFSQNNGFVKSDKYQNRRNQDQFNLKLGLFSGPSYNKVYDWDIAEVEYKFDATNFGITIQCSTNNYSSFIITYNYIHKGAYAPSFDQDYYFRYSVWSSSAQLVILKWLKINGGVYIGNILEYNVNGETKDLGRTDYGINFGPELEFKIINELSFFMHPIIEIGLTKFSYSKQHSNQLRLGLKYSLINWSE